jgi:hypothetical protein
MKKILLTGGPQGGKTTTLKFLADFYKDRVITVPEVASTLLQIFPMPGRDIILNEEWLSCFQKAVAPTQRELEHAWLAVALERKVEAIIFDRGLLDGAGYINGGRDAFSRLCGINYQEALERYELILHLETVAKKHPESFGNKNNDSRYENNAELAIKLDDQIQAAWNAHPNWHLISEETIDDVVYVVHQKINSFIG